MNLASCPVKGQVYESCPSCQGTCDNPVVACPLACTGDGCVCPPGQLIDTEANECVHPTQCPVNCSVSCNAWHKQVLKEKKLFTTNKQYMNAQILSLLLFNC